MTKRMKTYLKRFAAGQAGSVTLEFAILFPILISVMLSSVELGLMTFRASMLSRGLDQAVRTVRITNVIGLTHDQMKTLICANAKVIHNCESVVRLEMRPASLEQWVPLPEYADCIDRSLPISPVRTFTPGTANELMVLRACIKVSPLFPTTGFGLDIKKDGSGDYALIARSSYVQEPG